ncbi:hypothetical protein [Viridibacterium curvum]|uniref:Uncharacterized protein n=1 Tax=Viridibacterium curvum TaxID=1101404 RepID=A0ABP9QQZ8_9RHOO
MYRLHEFALLVVALTVASPAFAAEGAPPTLLPQPGRQVCHADTRQIGDVAARIELCVLGGRMSHDTYSLSIDRKSLLKGIDDETTTGLATTYQGDRLSLTCVPQNKAPKEVSAEKVAIFQEMRKVSAEEARRMIILMETVEVGRLCTARLGNTSLLEVQVLFE